MDTREQKLNSIIEAGRASVVMALSSITDEFERRRDMMVKPAAIEYEVDGGKIWPVIDKKAYDLTLNSRSKLLSMAGIPLSYMERLQGLGEFGLARQNLYTMTRRQMEDGVLIRQIPKVETEVLDLHRDGKGTYEVAGTIKGWLSPAYKRMDASPVFHSYVERSIAKGFVPYRGFNTDSRYQVAFILPTIFNPLPNEYVVFGTSLITSDYGMGALELSMMILRIICTNLAIGYDMFRRVHVGSRFQSDSDYIELSAKTLQLDGQTVASAMGDVIDASQKQIEVLEKKISEAGTREVNPKTIYESLRKKGVRKEITEQIKTFYESEVSVEALPQVQGAWRMANTISLIAQGVKNPDERIDLEKISMEIIN